ncbi:MAG: aspartate 1-decarboxylase [Pirellulaceae bacterium]
MLRTFLRSKIHRATVTQADLNYEGSIMIDQELLDAAGLLQFEKVEIYNVSNGNRLATYVIPGERGCGVICLNGAAARMASPGDLVIICCYREFTDEELESHRAAIIMVDESNRITSVDHRGIYSESPATT